MNQSNLEEQGPSSFKARFSRPSLGRTIAIASVLNLSSAGVAALAGIMIARILGPTLRGDYAAITAWFGAALVVGELGQPAAICYFVAKNPDRAKDYLATSRRLMLVSGAVVAISGFFIAEAVSNGHQGVTLGYRIVFFACPLIFVGASFLFALQATSIRQWAVISASQSFIYLLGIGGLALTGYLNLTSVLIALVGASALQACIAYWVCRDRGLSGGGSHRSLQGRVLKYGLSQILATAPTTINITLDELFLSQTVAAASLGNYAIAASITSLAYPLVAPIGSVLFPWVATHPRGEASRRIQLRSVGASLIIASIIMVAVCAAAPWVVPLVFGKRYSAVVPLVWILAPGGVFYTSSQVIGDLLRGQNRTLMIALAQGVGAVFTVVLLIVLVPIWSVRGAAVTSSISYAVTFLILAYGLVISQSNASDLLGLGREGSTESG